MSVTEWNSIPVWAVCDFAAFLRLGEREDTTAKVVEIINTKMAFTPPPCLRRILLLATGWARGVTLATGTASLLCDSLKLRCVTE